MSYPSLVSRWYHLLCALKAGLEAVSNTLQLLHFATLVICVILDRMRRQHRPRHGGVFKCIPTSVVANDGAMHPEGPLLGPARFASSSRPSSSQCDSEHGFGSRSGQSIMAKDMT